VGRRVVSQTRFERADVLKVAIAAAGPCGSQCNTAVDRAGRNFRYHNLGCGKQAMTGSLVLVDGRLAFRRDEGAASNDHASILSEVRIGP